MSFCHRKRTKSSGKGHGFGVIKNKARDRQIKSESVVFLFFSFYLAQSWVMCLKYVCVFVFARVFLFHSIVVSDGFSLVMRIASWYRQKSIVLLAQYALILFCLSSYLFTLFFVYVFLGMSGAKRIYSFSLCRIFGFMIDLVYFQLFSQKCSPNFDSKYIIRQK